MSTPTAWDSYPWFIAIWTTSTKVIWKGQTIPHLTSYQTLMLSNPSEDHPIWVRFYCNNIVWASYPAEVWKWVAVWPTTTLILSNVSWWLNAIHWGTGTINLWVQVI